MISLMGLHDQPFMQNRKGTSMKRENHFVVIGNTPLAVNTWRELARRGRPVTRVLREKPEMVHVILTGRNAHPTIVELADTVTEMRQVKHAYEKGVQAQRGIEY